MMGVTFLVLSRVGLFLLRLGSKYLELMFSHIFDLFMGLILIRGSVDKFPL